MKKFNGLMVAVLSTVLATVFVSSAFADALADLMDDMNVNMKTITKQASDSTQNTSSASLCDKVITDVAQAQTFTPTTISSLPAAQQAAAEAGYVALLGQLSDQLTTLKADFVAGNNTAAVAELAVINTTKTNGHKQYQ